jgi:hypothetical protein
MASSVACILGNAADGEAFSGQAHRLGMGSSATFTNTGSTPAVARSGIVPSGGTPLDVAPLGTPAMKVNVKAGTCVVQSTSATGGCFTVTLTTATDLDIGTSNPTNPRIDLVVAKVFADGTSATNCTVEVIAGTAAASPARPSISSPPANTHYFPLAQVRVEANATTIVAGKVTKVSGVDGLWTAAAGGLVPVASTADGATLPPFSPFVLPTGEQWLRYPSGVSSQYGNMHRYLRAISKSTGGAGDFTLDTSVFTAGVQVPSPFQNACEGAILLDGTNSSSFNEPVWFKLQSKTASAVTFRAYKASGVFTGATLDVYGIAWGW